MRAHADGKPNASAGLSTKISLRVALVRHPVEHHVEQPHVVRHRLEVLRVRPVRAPEQPRRRMLDQLLHQRVGVRERESRPAWNARRQLDPAAAGVEAFEHEPEAGAVDALGRIDAAHVLEHEPAGRVQDLRLPVRPLLGLDQIVIDQPCSCTRATMRWSIALSSRQAMR